MYTIPGEESWKVFLNSESGSFAFFEPDETKNVASINVYSYQLDKELEQFEKLQIEFAKLEDWKKGAQKVIWLVATAAGGMWVKHFMDLVMK